MIRLGICGIALLLLTVLYGILVMFVFGSDPVSMGDRFAAVFFGGLIVPPAALGVSEFVVWSLKS